MTTFLALALATGALADPCGMVPPAWIPVAEGEAPLIQRSGDQITYAFFKDGVQTMVLRPGFTGRVDEFGMLIPFPSPPSLRKTADNTFTQLAAAVDAPFMNVNIYYPPPVRYKRPQRNYPSMSMDRSMAAPEPMIADAPEALRFDEVRIVNQEAVGMYEVAVIQAGSSSALGTWMKDHDYKYPDGMDAVIDDYVAIKWSFVASKAKVGNAGGVAPTPGMRSVNGALPTNATFSGQVQGMGFRFEVDEPVIPMRLASFNEAPPRNLLYLMSEHGQRIDKMDVGLVKRQVKGTDVYRNLMEMIPVSVAGGETLTKSELAGIKSQRRPDPYSKTARELFAADLLAVETGELTLEFEDYEKQLLRVSESLGLRGTNIDTWHTVETDKKKDQELAKAIEGVKGMTLTVFEGDFDGVVMAEENLTFARWRLDDELNIPGQWSRRPAGPRATITRPWSERPNQGLEPEPIELYYGYY